MALLMKGKLLMAPKPKNNLFTFGRETQSKKRPKRIADMIKNEIALLLLHKVKDPRLSNVSIVGTEVTRDLRKAIVFYSVMGDDKQVKDAAEGLVKAKGFIRSHLARELGMRATPDLVFKLDLSMVHQQEMERLFKEIRADGKSSETGTESDN
jgi:ribosome-binding factor A